MADTITTTRAEVEDLLFEEAALLDDWKLEEWLLLYTDDARYDVPSTDLPAGADPGKALFYIADDRMRLQQRVVRLMKKSAHAEDPRSRTRHLVSNVRLGPVQAGTQGDELSASAAFATYRTKGGHTDTFVGALHYRLRRTAQGLRICAKCCVLDMDGLRPHGRISIIL